MSFGRVGTYADLCVVIKWKGDFDWPFDFWDKEENCQIRTNFESLKGLKKSLYVRQWSTDEVKREEGCKKQMKVREGSSASEAINLEDNRLDGASLRLPI
jgi:hypothetical protein